MQAEADGRAITKAKLDKVRVHRDREVHDNTRSSVVASVVAVDAASLSSRWCGCCGRCIAREEVLFEILWMFSVLSVLLTMRKQHRRASLYLLNHVSVGSRKVLETTSKHLLSV